MNASIIARLGLDSAGFQGGLKGALGQIKGFAGQFTAFLGAASLASLSKSVIDLGSKISDLGTQLRIGTDELQVLQYAATEAGVSQSILERALRNVTLRTEEALNGNKRYAEALARLNIDAGTFAELPTEKKLEMIAKAYASAGESQQAYSDVAVILGERAGPALSEVMQRLASEGFDGVAAAAKNAGAVIEEDHVTALDKMADKIELGKKKFLVALAPAIVFVVNQFVRFINFVKQVGALIGGVVATIIDFGNVSQAVFRPFISLIENAGYAVKGLWQAMTGDIDAALKSFDKVKDLDELVSEVKRVPEEASKAWEDFSKRAESNMQVAGEEMIRLEDEYKAFEKSLKGVEDQSKKTMQAVESVPGAGGNADKVAKARQVIEEGLADMERKRLPANQKLSALKKEQAEIDAQINAGAEDSDKLARKYLSLQRERLSLEKEIAGEQKKAHEERMAQLQERVKKELDARKGAIDDKLGKIKQGLEGKGYSALLKEAPEQVRRKALRGEIDKEKGETGADALRREIGSFRDAQAEAAKKQLENQAKQKLEQENKKGIPAGRGETEVTSDSTNSANPNAPAGQGSDQPGSTEDMAADEQAKQEDMNARLDEFQEIATAIQTALEANNASVDAIRETLGGLDTALK